MPEQHGHRRVEQHRACRAAERPLHNARSAVRAHHEQIGATPARERDDHLAGGTALDKVDGVTKFADGPKKVEMNSILLAPVPITKDNLNVVIDAGWVSKDVVCQGVAAGTVPACG